LVSLILPRQVTEPLVNLKEAMDHAAKGIMRSTSNSTEVAKSWSLQKASKT